MKHLSFTILILSIVLSGHITNMEAPLKRKITSWDSLPSDVKRILIPFIASSNVSEVAKTILSLNHTNKFFREFVRSEAGFISILEQMPYTANAIDLIERLRQIKKSEEVLPVLYSQTVMNWYESATKRLEGEQELFEAVIEGVPNNQEEFEALFKEGAPKKLGGSPTKVKALLKNKNINLNGRGLQGGTGIILISAVNIGNEEIVEALLKAGANPNVQTFSHGITPLIASIYLTIDSTTRRNIARMLLQAGADPNLAKDGRQTPLMLSAAASHKDIFKMLLEAGANPLLKDQEGKRALDYATDEIQKMVCDALVRCALVH